MVTTRPHPWHRTTSRPPPHIETDRARRPPTTERPGQRTTTTIEYHPRIVLEPAPELPAADPALLDALAEARKAHAAPPRPRASPMNDFAPEAPVDTDPGGEWWTGHPTNAALARTRNTKACRHYGVSTDRFVRGIAARQDKVDAELASAEGVADVSAKVLGNQAFDRAVLIPRAGREAHLLFSANGAPDGLEDVSRWYRAETWPQSTGDGYAVATTEALTSPDEAAAAASDFLSSPRDAGHTRTVVLVGHGARADDGGRGLLFTADNAAEDVLNAYDTEEWAKIGASLQPGDIVVVQSCFAAGRADDRLAWATIVQDHFPAGTRLVLPLGLVNETSTSEQGWLRLGKPLRRAAKSVD